MSRPLTEKEIEKELRRFIKAFEYKQSVGEKFYKLTGCSPESELMCAMYIFMEHYMDLLAEKIGIGADWLGWFVWDNELGKKKLEAKAGSWPKPKPIPDVKSFAKLAIALRDDD